MGRNKKAESGPSEPSSPPSSKKKPAATAPPSPAARVLTQRAVYGAHTTPVLTRRKSSRSSSRRSTLYAQTHDDTNASLGSANMSIASTVADMSVASTVSNTTSENLTFNLNSNTLDESAYKKVISKPGWSKNLSESMQNVPLADLTSGTADDSMMTDSDVSMQVKSKRSRRAPPRISIGAFQKAMASDTSNVNSDTSRISTRSENMEVEEDLEVSLTYEPSPVKRFTRKKNKISVSTFQVIRQSDSPVKETSAKSSTDIDSAAIIKSPLKPATPEKKRRVPSRVSVGVFHRAVTEDNSDSENDAPIQPQAESKNETCPKSVRIHLTRVKSQNMASDCEMSDIESPVVKSSIPRKKRVAKKINPDEFHQAMIHSEEDSSEEPMTISSPHDMSILSDVDNSGSTDVSARTLRTRTKQNYSQAFDDITDDDNSLQNKEESISSQDNSISSVVSSPAKKPARKQRLKEIDTQAFGGIVDSDTSISSKRKKSTVDSDDSLGSSSPAIKRKKKQKKKNNDEHAYDELLDSFEAETSFENSSLSKETRKIRAKKRFEDTFDVGKVNTSQRRSERISLNKNSPATKSVVKNLTEHRKSTDGKDGTSDFQESSFISSARKQKASVDQVLDSSGSSTSVSSPQSSPPLTKGARKQMTEETGQQLEDRLSENQQMVVSSQDDSVSSSIPVSPVQAPLKQRTKEINPHAFDGVLDSDEGMPESPRSGSHDQNVSSVATKAARKQMIENSFEVNESANHKSNDVSQDGSLLNMGRPATKAAKKQIPKPILVDTDSSSSESQQSNEISTSISSNKTPVRKTKEIDPLAFEGVLNSEEDSNTSLSSLNTSQTVAPVINQRAKEINPFAFFDVLNSEESQKSSVSSQDISVASIVVSPVTKPARNQRAKEIDPHAFDGILESEESIQNMSSHNGSIVSTGSIPDATATRKQRTKQIDPRAFDGVLDSEESVQNASSYNDSIPDATWKQRSNQDDPDACEGDLEFEELLFTSQESTSITEAAMKQLKEVDPLAVDGLLPSLDSFSKNKNVLKPVDILSILNGMSSSTLVTNENHNSEMDAAGLLETNDITEPENNLKNIFVTSEKNHEAIDYQVPVTQNKKPNSSVDSRHSPSKNLRSSTQKSGEEFVSPVISKEKKSLRSSRLTDDSQASDNLSLSLDMTAETRLKQRAKPAIITSAFYAAVEDSEMVSQINISQSSPTHQLTTPDIQMQEPVDVLELSEVPSVPSPETATRKTRQAKKVSISEFRQALENDEENNAENQRTSIAEENSEKSHQQGADQESDLSLKLNSSQNKVRKTRIPKSFSIELFGDVFDYTEGEEDVSDSEESEILEDKTQNTPKVNRSEYMESLGQSLSPTLVEQHEESVPTASNSFAAFAKSSRVRHSTSPRPADAVSPGRRQSQRKLNSSKFINTMNSIAESPDNQSEPQQQIEISFNEKFAKDSPSIFKSRGRVRHSQLPHNKTHTLDMVEELDKIETPEKDKIATPEKEKYETPKRDRSLITESFRAFRRHGPVRHSESPPSRESTHVMSEVDICNGNMQSEGEAVTETSLQMDHEAIVNESLVTGEALLEKEAGSIGILQCDVDVVTETPLENHLQNKTVESESPKESIPIVSEKEISDGELQNEMEAITETPHENHQQNKTVESESPSESIPIVSEKEISDGELQNEMEAITETPLENNQANETLVVERQSSGETVPIVSNSSVGVSDTEIVTKESLQNNQSDASIAKETQNENSPLESNSPHVSQNNDLQGDIEIATEKSLQNNQSDASVAKETQNESVSLEEINTADQSDSLHLSLDVDLEKTISKPRKKRPTKADVSASVFVEALESDQIPQSTENLDVENTSTVDALQFSVAELKEAVNSLVSSTHEVVPDTEEAAETTTETRKKYSLSEFHKAMEVLDNNTSVTETNSSFKLPERQTRRSSRNRKSSIESSILSLDTDSMSSASLNISNHAAELTPRSVNRTAKSSKSLRRFSFTSRKSYARKRYTLIDLQIAMEAVRSPSLVSDTSTVNNDYQSKSMFSIRDLEKAVKTLKAETTIGGDLTQDLSTSSIPQTLSKTAPSQTNNVSTIDIEDQNASAPTKNHENITENADKTFEDLEIENNLRSIMTEEREIYLNYAEMPASNNVMQISQNDADKIFENEEISEANEITSAQVIVDKTVIVESQTVDNSKLDNNSNRPDESEVNTTVIPVSEMLALKTPQSTKAILSEAEISIKSTSAVDEDLAPPDDSDGSESDSEKEESEPDQNKSQLSEKIADESSEEEEKSESEPEEDDTQNSDDEIQNSDNEIQHSASTTQNLDQENNSLAFDETVIFEDVEKDAESDSNKSQKSHESLNNNLALKQAENSTHNENGIPEPNEVLTSDETVAPKENEVENIPESLHAPQLDHENVTNEVVDRQSTIDISDQEENPENELAEVESQHSPEQLDQHNFSGIFSSISSKKSTTSVIEENESRSRQTSSTRRDLSKMFQASTSGASRRQTVANLSGVGDLETRPSLEAMFDNYQQLLGQYAAADKRNDQSKVSNVKKTARLPLKQAKRVLSPTVAAARMINGVQYRKPLKRKSKPWVTDRLYDYLHTQFTKIDKIKAYKMSEDFVDFLVENVSKVTRSKKKLDNVIKRIAEHLQKYGFVKTNYEFFTFCSDYLPEPFVAKAFSSLDNTYLSVKI